MLSYPDKEGSAHTGGEDDWVQQRKNKIQQMWSMSPGVWGLERWINHDPTQGEGQVQVTGGQVSNLMN